MNKNYIKTVRFELLTVLKIQVMVIISNLASAKHVFIHCRGKV